MNILIVKLSAVGDVIHTLPSLAALRRCYPAADITWVVEEGASDLLTGHPALNRVIVSRRKTWLRQLQQGRFMAPLREMAAFVRELRKRPYEVVIDFHGLLKSALIVALSRGKRRLGYASFQELSGFFYNEKIPEDMGKHAVDRYLDLVRYLAGTDPPDAMAALEMPPEFTISIGTEEECRIKALLNRHVEVLGEGKAPFVSVSPIALWETKLWEEKRFALLCDRIRQELGLGIVMTGSKADLLTGIQERMETQAVNLGGQTSLRELACLYRETALVITTDSGPMHLAAAVGTPVVALFGPTDPARTGPYGPGHRVVRSKLACAPCFRKKCGTKACMTEITVDEVFKVLKAVLQKNGFCTGGGAGGMTPGGGNES